MAADGGKGMLAMLAPKELEGPPMPDPEGEEASSDDDLSMVAGDVMQALKDKDSGAFAESLKAFVSMC